MSLIDFLVNVELDTPRPDYRALLTRWLDNTPAEWGLREENATCPTRGAALPMGFNRTPHYADGLMLVGDSGGMVNPFNGEGIAYAMEAARLGSSVVADAFGAAKNGGDVARENRTMEASTARPSGHGWITFAALFAIGLLAVIGFFAVVALSEA